MEVAPNVYVVWIVFIVPATKIDKTSSFTKLPLPSSFKSGTRVRGATLVTILITSFPACGVSTSFFEQEAAKIPAVNNT